MRFRNISFACIWAVVLLITHGLYANAQLHCLPTGNNAIIPGNSWVITAGVGQIPPGAYVDNYKIWVNGVPHNGNTYTLVTSPSLDPYEYIYYATATFHYQNQAYTIDSRTPSPAGDGRSGDLIAISVGQLDTVLYTGDFPLYERNYYSGNIKGRDVPRPQFSAAGNFPVCYARGSAMTANFHTTGSGTNNNVTLKYTVTAQLLYPDPDTGYLIPENVPGWPLNIPPTPYTAGLTTAFTTPSLPNYIFKHFLKLDFSLVAIYSVDQSSLVRSLIAITTPVYAVFSDPNATFPPYHVGDDDNNPLQTKPWYEIIENAINHVTNGDRNATVTDTFSAVQNLTTDLYVWPNRPDGPSTSVYNYQYPRFYLRDSGQQIVRFNLWGMTLGTRGDCQDFAAYLECQARSLGISNVQKIHLGTPYGGAFTTNPTIPCGDSAAQVYGFNFHQMAYWPDGGGIFDWAIAYPYSDGEHPWTLSIGFSQSQQYSSLIQSFSLSNSPAWSPSFALGNPDPVFSIWYGGNWPTIISSVLAPPP
jgi:hypothetical protein